jgi:signal peptidase I
MIKRLLFLAIIAGIITLGVREYVVEGIYVASGSMEPTLTVGTHLFLEKVTFKFKKPAYGDIVVFPSPVTMEKDLIKRVIGLPGDTIEIRSKAVYRNGSALDEPYVKHTRATEALEDDNLAPITIPADMAFVLGDNRDESNDSRDWKDEKTGEHHYFIALDSIKGKLIHL